MDSIEAVVSSLIEPLRSGEFLDAETLKNTENGISLLALKNDVLLSYISNLLVLAAAQLEQNEQVFGEARKRSIDQRITLEKGIKGLEAKISYQIDKALRAYRRAQEKEEQEARAASDAEDSDSDAEATSYRPNVGDLRASRDDGNDDEDYEDGKRYVVPKITSTAPSFETKKSRSAPRRRDFAMEEYLKESGDAPVAEPSIGSQIMDFGRGGERTDRERRKERDVQNYEEANFTRISNVSSKRARKDAFQRQRAATTKNFFGEDWGFLDDSGKSSNGKKRKTKH